MESRFIFRMERREKWTYLQAYTSEANKKTKVLPTKIEWLDVNKLPSNVIPNLKWMIPLAKNKLTDEKELDKIEVHYR